VASGEEWSAGYDAPRELLADVEVALAAAPAA
jgi:hypothetical protein